MFRKLLVEDRGRGIGGNHLKIMSQSLENHAALTLNITGYTWGSWQTLWESFVIQVTSLVPEVFTQLLRTNQA